MALHEWIDKISDRWATIETHDGNTLRAHKIFVRDDFPESITAPAVLTYPSGVGLYYSQGGPVHAHWVGRSDFYLFDNVSKSNLPRLVPYYEKIYISVLGNLTLDNAVVEFSIQESELGQQSIQGPVELSYGNDGAPMLGLIVNWRVKDDISNDSGVTVAA